VTNSAGKASTPELGCPFCKRIAAGEYDYDNDRCVAFQPLNPVTPGHFLVVPRRHVSNAFANPLLAGKALTFAGYLANQMGLGAANFITSAGLDATQSVFHLHLHVVPRRPGDGLVLPWTHQQAELAKLPGAVVPGRSAAGGGELEAAETGEALMPDELPTATLSLADALKASLRRHRGAADGDQVGPGWLAETFAEAKRDYESLPSWARPVVTAPLESGGADGAPR
jgi:histidine triad (HIT) family protein